MDVNLILAVTGLHILALITPGPDFVLTVKNSLQFGLKTGFATAVGFGLGIGLHMSYCIGGIAILMKTFPQIFEVMKALGALYLIWIGLNTLWAQRKKVAIIDPTLGGPKTNKPQSALLMGFLTNILNPKATLFILGLFTSVIPPETDLKTMITIGVIIVLATITWFTLVAALFATQRIRVMYLKAERTLNIIFGAFFVTAGIIVLFNR